MVVKLVIRRLCTVWKICKCMIQIFVKSETKSYKVVPYGIKSSLLSSLHLFKLQSSFLWPFDINVFVFEDVHFVNLIHLLKSSKYRLWKKPTITTVPLESVFSTRGQVLDAFRSLLTPKTGEGLICAQNWLKSKIISSVKKEDEEHKVEQRIPRPIIWT